MTTADKIKYIMRHNGWTKDVCADEIGVHVTQLNRWLRGVEPSEKNMGTIDNLYIQLVFKPKTPKYIPKKREKIVIEYPYYSHQRMPWENKKAKALSALAVVYRYPYYTTKGDRE